MATAWPDGTLTARDRDAEQWHELRSALFGIEASAHGLSHSWAQLSSVQINHVTQTLAHEVRRVRALLDGRVGDNVAFDLAAAIEPAVTSARACGQQVDNAVPGGLLVHGRPDTATQVVVTLLENARRHAAGSPVQLCASVRGTAVTLSVEDRGPGIARRLRARLFERGVRGDTSTGSGLGLFIARRLMSEQGGSIACHRRRGGGTSFVLRFRSADPK